jgi:hypothetical protein
MSAAPDRLPTSLTGLQLRLVEFLRDIANSPNNAVFVIVTDNLEHTYQDVVEPMREIAGQGLCLSPRRRELTVFGRRMFIVIEDHQLRGFGAHGIWVHGFPRKMPLVDGYLEARLVPGGRMYG